jgi:hypothetical protein
MENIKLHLENESFLKNYTKQTNTQTLFLT